MSNDGEVSSANVPVSESRFLIDPYREWAEGEGIPIHLDFGHNLLELETGPWDRYDARGCFAHTHGAGDFMANYVLDIGPGAKTRPVKHLYEVFCFVLAGHGSTKVWLPNGETRVFEWGPKAMFAIPLNCQYQIFNSVGSRPVRISCTNDAPITINLYHNLDFVFDNPCTFPERAGQSKHFEGEGDLSHGDWREAHVAYFTREAARYGLTFTEEHLQHRTHLVLDLHPADVVAHDGARGDCHPEGQLEEHALVDPDHDFLRRHFPRLPSLRVRRIRGH